MEQDDAIEVLAALAHPTRMSVFRLLVQAGPAGLPALKISRQLGVVASTLSGHLAILKRSGVLSATRHQREIHYAANLSMVNELVAFLLSDCCGGQVNKCSEILSLLSLEAADAGGAIETGLRSG